MALYIATTIFSVSTPDFLPVVALNNCSSARHLVDIVGRFQVYWLLLAALVELIVWLPVVNVRPAIQVEVKSLQCPILMTSSGVQVKTNS